MSLDKREKPVSFKMSAKLKNMVEEEREIDGRQISEMLNILIAEAVHERRMKRKFMLRDYM